VQLAKLPEANAARAGSVARYFFRLDAMKEFLSVPFRHYDRGTSTYHIMPVLPSKEIDRAALIERMKEDGIQTSIQLSFDTELHRVQG